jgi:hypothetical protein
MNSKARWLARYRMMTRKMGWGVIVLVTASTLEAQKYPIHLSIPVHVGQTFVVSAPARKVEGSAITSQTLAQRSSEMEVSFEGLAEVLEVDDSSEGAKIAFTAKNFKKNEAG